MLPLAKLYLTLLQFRAVQAVMQDDLLPINEQSGPIIRRHFEEILTCPGGLNQPLEYHTKILLSSRGPYVDESLW